MCGGGGILGGIGDAIGGIGDIINQGLVGLDNVVGDVIPGGWKGVANIAGSALGVGPIGTIGSIALGGLAGGSADFNVVKAQQPASKNNAAVGNLSGAQGQVAGNGSNGGVSGSGSSNNALLGLALSNQNKMQDSAPVTYTPINLFRG